LDAKTRIVLYQGYLQAERFLDQIIRAAAFLEQGIVLVMMGKNVGTTQAELAQLIVSEGVTDRVRIIAAVPYEELLEWTASADVGLIVYPPEHSRNVQMCLPNKFFEYLMAGLPILASSLDAIMEIIAAYRVGHVVTELSPQMVGAAINAMVADVDELACMRENALQAAKEFCWEKECHRLFLLYSTIVESRMHGKNLKV
jgi:glycosyltransferase involved in cell wall biosynthesis